MTAYERHRRPLSREEKDRYVSEQAVVDRMGAELRIAQEENRPYVLLWGRRKPMCTRPATARPADSMYSWTLAILQDQILGHRRLSARSHQKDGAAT